MPYSPCFFIKYATNDRSTNSTKWHTGFCMRQTRNGCYVYVHYKMYSFSSITPNIFLVKTDMICDRFSMWLTCISASLACSFITPCATEPSVMFCVYYNRNISWNESNYSFQSFGWSSVFNLTLTCWDTQISYIIARRTLWKRILN